MKWTLRILGTLTLWALLSVAGAWLTFPWYAQALLDRVSAGSGIRLQLHEPGRPDASGMGFRRLDAIVTTRPDTCTGIASTFDAAIFNGRLTWRRFPYGTGRTASIVLEADSVTVLMKPAGIRFSDARPRIMARLDITRQPGARSLFSPDSISYAVEGARIATGQLRLGGVTYAAMLTRSNRWIQQPSRFKAETLSSGEAKTPLTGFEATFGMARNPEKPCTLTFSDCSMLLFGIRASTPEIDYSLRTKRTAFVLNLDRVPIDRLAGAVASGLVNPVFSGNLTGSIPVEYLDSTIRVNKGIVDADTGSLLTFRDAKGNPLLSFDAGRRPGGPPFISGLTAEVTLDGKHGRLSEIRFDTLSARVFEGAVSADPARYDVETGSSSFSFKLSQIPLLDRIRLAGALSGKLRGTVTGTIPCTLKGGRIAIRGARLASPGGGRLRQATPKKTAPSSASYAGSGESVDWSFSGPAVVLDRDLSGRTKIAFTLKGLTRKSGGGELALVAPRGVVGLPADAVKPLAISLSGFSAGLLGGTVSIDHVDYDLKTKHAETIVQISGIPLQTLLDLQGTKKIFATGSLRGKVPVVLDGESFSIPDGGLDAEKSGQIIYSSTPEERATANAGMKITYEALGNFLYSELISRIAMTPDGNSHITLTLKGFNPDFQKGRQVNLNLNIEQNLNDLFRSLSIPSEIEQSISEKVLEKQKKR